MHLSALPAKISRSGIVAGNALHGAFAPTTSPFSTSQRLLIPKMLAVPGVAKVCSSGASRVYGVVIAGIAACSAHVAHEDGASLPDKP